ncbi:ABC transporter permease [Histidinibacterium lentulum]|uniref:ABC transporter permease n=1 Tax=Histidinibacterium lentulum TaxID=2480588 RepID=A0A3N2QR93_9RHOB|nr:ABC transporter permease [Histidinibacterium lentulum]ROT97700.1 ABC transporter permease [Histidinibacterium lentulum]
MTVARPDPETIPARTPGRLRRLAARMGWLETVALVSLGVITLLALIAPWITPFDPYLRVAPAHLPPGWPHLFGTDDLGRDLFSRVLLGVTYTWLPGLCIILVALVVGTALGLAAGTMGGTADLVIMRLVELFLVLPSTLIALAVVAALGPGLVNTMIAITIFWWPWYTRIVRDEVCRLRVRPHVEAARIGGSRGTALVLRHIAPGVVPALLVTATLDVANVIMTLSLMSFLGLGQPAPAPELGAMTARGIDSLTVFWWLPILPAVAIMVMCLMANLAGDGLRRAVRGA